MNNTIIIPPEEKIAYYNHKHIKNLIVSEGVVELYCYNNQIESLILPSTLKILNADRNNLKQIVVNGNMEKLSCCFNDLEELVIEYDIKIIYISIITNV